MALTPYTNVADALKAIDLALEDTLRDAPHLANQEDSLYWDMAQSVMGECDSATASELSRVSGVDLPSWL
jgi:hypothetical protein